MSEMRFTSTENAPAAIGPYSQAVVVDGFVFCSGQIPLDPASGQLLDGDETAQTELVLKNLAAVLDASGASMSSVVKTTVFLKDMGDFAAMNEVYARHIGDHRPARAAVQAARLPKDVAVEIECIARVSGARNGSTTPS